VITIAVGAVDGRLIRCIQGDLQAQNPPAARDPVTSSRNRPDGQHSVTISFRVTDPVYHAAHENFLFSPLVVLVVSIPP